MKTIDEIARGLAERFAYLGRPIMRPEMFDDDIKSAIKQVADDAARQMRDEAVFEAGFNFDNKKLADEIMSIPLPSERNE